MGTFPAMPSSVHGWNANRWHGTGHVRALGIFKPVFVLSASKPRLRSEGARLEVAPMPLYMDTHRNVDGLTEEGLRKAHEADLATQGKHGVNYLRYWFNEDKGTAYCLVDAPTAEAAARVHREAHGLVADEIVEVHEGH